MGDLLDLIITSTPASAPGETVDFVPSDDEFKFCFEMPIGKRICFATAWFFGDEKHMTKMHKMIEKHIVKTGIKLVLIKDK